MSQDFPASRTGGFDDLGAFFHAPAATTVPRPAASVPNGGAPTAQESDRTLLEILASLEEGALDLARLGRDASSMDAGAASRARGSAAGMRVVSFTAGGTVYGARVPEIVEIARVPAITPVPQLPAWVRGVTNLRGDVVSVIDLAALSGRDSMSLSAGRMLVARHEEGDLTIGILVDRVHEIAALTLDEIRQPAAPLDGPLAPFTRGVCQRGEQTLVMLDLAALLQSPVVRQFEDSQETLAG